MVRISLPFALVFTLVAAPFCQGAKVKVWDQHSPSHYEKAQFQQAVVSSEGVVRLGRQLKPFADLDAAHVWDLVEANDGVLFAAAGDEGKVYKIAPDGKTSIVYADDQSRPFCLALAGGDAVYVGAGPHGQILRVDGNGKTKVVCDTGEPYVWSMAVDPKSGTLYAGSGPHGRIYKISPEGKGEVLYAAKQDHVLCVATGPDGAVYAGVDKSGLVYRIDAKGKAFVLYQAAQAEIRTLKATADAVYVGTSAPTKRHGGAVASASGSGVVTADLTSSKPETAAVVGIKVSKEKEEKPSKDADSKESKGSPACAPSSPSGGDNSVYRIALDGSVREVFRAKAMMLCQARQGDHLFVGTGMEGELFDVDEATSEHSEIVRLDHGQVLCMCQRRDGSIILGAGDPGKLYVLEDHFAVRGTMVSEVLDTKLVSKWGALRWQADAPVKTAVSVAVRSGNTAEPDDAWSDWSAEQTDAGKAVIQAPQARFLQYRLTISSNDPAVTPSVRGVTLRYQTTNQAPEVTKVEAPDLDAVNLETPKKLKFKWAAVDANEDELSFALYVRKDGWKGWMELEDDCDKSEYEWDATTAPDGVYQLKVVASDRKDNSDAEALTGERTSSSFVVCHTAPAVKVKATPVAGGTLIEASAASPLVRLTSASYSLNGKKWVNVFPADGLFDSTAKTFRFKTDAMKPGTYVVVLRVHDAAGNTGSGDVVFTVGGAE
jgi:hypothetical protein